MASHGVGLNVFTDLRWFDRIVACGLAGKRATSLKKEGVEKISVEDVAEVLAQCMAGGLENVDAVENIMEKNVLALQAEAVEGVLI